VIEKLSLLKLRIN